MNNIRVIFNTWAGAFFQKGGGEVQLIETKKAIEKKRIKVDFFDQWAPEKGADILHQFSVQAGVEHVVKRYKNLGFKIATSPILWFSPERGSHEFNRIKYILNSSDIIFTNSHIETKIISQHYEIDIDRFHKTRNSISEDFFSKTELDVFRKKYNIDYEFILTVGNIDERKATHLLVDACKKLNKKLIIIGHIKEPAYFETFRSEYDGCKFLGPEEDVRILKSAYATCELFALPSYCETPGIAALEAGSQGAKILITEEGSTEEYFKEFATYTSPWDSDSIARGISLAISKERRTGIEEFIKKNYSWSQTAEEIIEGYNKILRS